MDWTIMKNEVNLVILKLLTLDDEKTYCKLHFSFSASSSCFMVSIRSTKAIFSWAFQGL